MFDWLTGTMGTSIQFPKVFDLKGILSIIMQVAGITWAFIRSKLVNIFGEAKVKHAEDAVAVVKKFREEGIMGIWEWIKDSAQMLMDTMISGIKEWTLTKLVIGFAEWIAMLLIPGAGLVKVVQGIYKLVMWFVDNIKRIISWVNSVLDSLSNIAAGVIAAAIKYIVDAMRKIIPVILDFFAKLLNISGIVQAVKNIINKIAGPIHKAIDKFIEWLKALLNKVVDKVKGAFGKKDEKKKPAAQEQRSQEQMQKDLNSGVSEATSYLKDTGSKKKEDINKHFNQIETKYGLTDLAVVTEKHNETGKDLVHVHGKVNPEKDGESVEVELDEGTSLKAKDLPVKTKDLIKAKYVNGRFLADVKEIHEPDEKNEKDYVLHEFRYKKLSQAKQENTFKQFLDKWANKDIEKVNEERKHLIENRPSFRAGLVEEVWENAKNKRNDKRVFDPHIFPPKELFWDESKGRFDQWHMGHKQGKKYSGLVDEYINGNISWEEFLAEYNNAGNYYPEDPKSNMSHQFEL